MWGVQEMGIVLVLVLVWLIGWLRLKEEGGMRKEVLLWWSVVEWSVMWCGVVWVRKKIRCDGLLLLLLLCSE